MNQNCSVLEEKRKRCSASPTFWDIGLFDAKMDNFGHTTASSEALFACFLLQMLERQPAFLALWSSNSQKITLVLTISQLSPDPNLFARVDASGIGIAYI